MSILAVLQVAQTYSGPHNVMSPLPSRMLVDDRYATMACQQRLVLTKATVCVWVCWYVCVCVWMVHIVALRRSCAHCQKNFLVWFYLTIKNV